MILVVGQRFAGSVERVGRARIVTEFLHVLWLPAVPIRSLLLLDRGARPIPMHVGSVVAGYGRTWGPVAALFVWLLALPWIADHIDRAVVYLVVFGCLAALLACAWLPFFAIGRLTRAQRAARSAFARFLGAPVDPVTSGVPIGELREALRAELEERSPGPATYRRATDLARGGAGMLASALSSDDPRAIEAALVLARIEESESAGAEARAYARVFEELSSKLASLPPALPLDPQ